MQQFSTAIIRSDPTLFRPTTHLRKVDLLIIGDHGSGKLELASVLAAQQEKLKIAIKTHFRRQEKGLLTSYFGKPSSKELLVETTIRIVPSTSNEEPSQVSRFVSSHQENDNYVAILILCLPLDLPGSTRRINSYWLSQLTDPSLIDAPLILVGTKSDLRTKFTTGHLLGNEKATALANWMGATGYVECSSKTPGGMAALSEKIAAAANVRQKDQLERFARRKANTAFASNRVKIVLVGDGCCGKNSLARTFCEGKFPRSSVYQPTPFEQYEATVRHVAEGDDPRDFDVSVSIWVTAGREAKRGTVDWHDRVRALAYPDANVVLLCFAIDQPDAQKRILQHWVVELQLYCPKLPIILVGLKKDLRSDGMPNRLEGEMLAKRIGAVAYVECSSKTNGPDVKKPFEAAITAVFERQAIESKDASASNHGLGPGWLSALLA